MKLLYITPKINDEGGVQKVLSVRTNYFIEKFNYKIDILTQNSGNQNLFFDFNKKIVFYDMILSGNKISKIINYRKQILEQIKISKPDFIIICDFGLKAFLIPFLFQAKIPIIFEAHGSIYNEPIAIKNSLTTTILRKIKYKFRGFAAKKFDYFIALSKESLSEWNNKNGIVIPNPIENISDKIALLGNKKIIVVARHSYEKGIDRLLPIWNIVSQKHPDWQLNIYGKSDENLEFNHLSNKKNINFLEPVKNIKDKYLESSICLMTSRSEAFPLVLLEAMSCGLPIIAYDCPIGPRAIIQNNENGFLIPDGNINLFTEKLSELIENENLRKTIGQHAKISIEKYNIDAIMETWNDLFLSIKKN